MSKVGGRPSKLTRELIEEFCKMLRMGVLRETAANMLGIGHSTLYKWLQDAEDHTETRGQHVVHVVARKSCRHFRDAILKAEAQGEMYLVETIRKSAYALEIGRNEQTGQPTMLLVPKDWKAAAYLLEKKFPIRWGGRDPSEVPPEPGQVAVTETLQRTRRVVFGGRYKEGGAFEPSSIPTEPKLLVSPTQQIVAQEALEQKTLASEPDHGPTTPDDAIRPGPPDTKPPLPDV